jgi:YVTN family beta-propeller protein
VKYFLVICSLCLCAFDSYAQQKKVLLPNGWTLTPAGKMVTLGDLPLNMTISGDGKYLAVTNNGVSTQTIQLLDAKTYKVFCSSEIAESWLGLRFSADSKYLYASGGNDNRIVKYAINKDTLTPNDTIVLGKKWPEKISPAGLDIDDKAQKLYVVTKENNSLYIADLKTKQVIARVQLSAEAYTCLLSPDKKTLYISVWGGSKLMVFDTKTATIKDSITIGRNPNDICMTRNGRYVFVANSIDNTVSVIDAASRKVIETLNAALYPDALSGSTTNSVALSGDNKTLYIANADNNCLAVFDVSTPGASHSKGFIPTGWYPTCVSVKGNTLLVLNGKGSTSLPNPKGPQPVKKGDEANYKKAGKKRDQYIGSLFTGTMSIIDVPDAKKLGAYSKQVYSNTPYTKEREMQTAGEPGNPIPMKVGAASPIKHVFYIIKENRTYDQVLGDMPEGNGDTSLVLFGKKITPNEHAVAEQFVLLDNFYVDAEVSADGHNWSTTAYANDYIEKTWPTNYGNRGGTYDYAANKKIALPKNGFLWDYALRAGLSIRDYGEFTDDDGSVYLPELQKRMCPGYPGWNLNIRDQAREKIWEKDFDSLVAVNAVPQLNIIYFPSDHTAGLGKKSRTPYAFVADNDQAVGQFIAHLAASPVWKNSAVFILEDDAQNGPDHVDAHRSTAFVAGPFVKRKFVDHSMYSTTGMLRTIELILGIPPMSQYDAAATPMYRCFTANADNTVYKSLPAEVDMEEMNLANNELSKQSEYFDLSKADKVPDKELNEVIWKSIKGGVAFPAPKRAAFVALHTEQDDD